MWRPVWDNWPLGPSNTKFSLPILFFDVRFPCVIIMVRKSYFFLLSSLWKGCFFPSYDSPTFTPHLHSSQLCPPPPASPPSAHIFSFYLPFSRYHRFSFTFTPCPRPFSYPPPSSLPVTCGYFPSPGGERGTNFFFAINTPCRLHFSGLRGEWCDPSGVPRDALLPALCQDPWHHPAGRHRGRDDHQPHRECRLLALRPQLRARELEKRGGAWAALVASHHNWC